MAGMNALTKKALKAQTSDNLGYTDMKTVLNHSLNSSDLNCLWFSLSCSYLDS